MEQGDWPLLTEELKFDDAEQSNVLLRLGCWVNVGEFKYHFQHEKISTTLQFQQQFILSAGHSMTDTNKGGQ